MSTAPESTTRPPADASRLTFDQVDTLVRVTMVRTWVYLAAVFVVSGTAVAFALIYEVPTKVQGEGTVDIALRYNKSGGKWLFDRAEIIRSTLSSDQATAAQACMQASASGSS